MRTVSRPPLPCYSLPQSPEEQSVFHFQGYDTRKTLEEKRGQGREAKRVVGEEERKKKEEEGR